ncbi:ATP-dependent RNA helicase Rpm2 [Schizosaccharomyces cryophilus OY26]|uniref:RNA helicase n=1 Tax=Schizosaccharomyces cryophilus (strain OY26 / ATCC MYA-4695 / CBS 11777 / NBRC 106824 / NRRL Y48691) TaxID=653667 RepID=S9W1X0_SCHCR|nr:ATP-dependent RNA helicase Rpm2 [Schizosaccharomyces cryophilus OY26]EPY52329.1 ATP-dependent RNA helicase Rpm2 [Schizosaccharomyces cryophilus OY26]
MKFPFLISKFQFGRCFSFKKLYSTVPGKIHKPNFLAYDSPGNILWRVALKGMETYFTKQKIEYPTQYLPSFLERCRNAKVNQEIPYFELKKKVLRSLIKSGSGFSSEIYYSNPEYLEKPVHRKNFTFYVSHLQEIIAAEFFKYARYKDILANTNVDLQRQLTKFTNPGELYPAARSQKRHIIMHVGPTNSGKTYHALQRLKQSKRGVYAGPLRLLAHEVYNRLNADGIRCNLLTGEEIREPHIVPHVVSCTVEMCSIYDSFEVAVIDEIQMIADPDRGFAWTNCLLGLQAKEIHLCGEESAVNLVKSIAKLTRDDFTVYRYNRLNRLKVAKASLRGKLKLQEGDCLVAFSRKDIFALKEKVEEKMGRRAAVIYGSLPPEVRNQQASLFNSEDHEEKILLASDAIGMGLNLTVKRIIFHKLKKFSGTEMIDIPIPQVKQIAGRAGRHQANTDSEQSPGVVTTLYDEDYEALKRAMKFPIKNLTRASIKPPDFVFEKFCSLFPNEVPVRMILERYAKLFKVQGPFSASNFNVNFFTLDLLDTVKELTIEDKISLLGIPIAKQMPQVTEFAYEIGKHIASGKRMQIYDHPYLPLDIIDRGIPRTNEALIDLERLHKKIVVYLWVSLRYPNIILPEAALMAKKITEELLARGLAHMKSSTESSSSSVVAVDN